MKKTIIPKKLGKKALPLFQAGNLPGFVLFFLLLFPVLALFYSCDQSPIFYAISQEEKPKDPRIKGSPTDIVRLDDTVYVASSGAKSIQCYDVKAEKWGDALSISVGTESIGAIRALAGAGTVLYALAGDIYRYENSSWTKMPEISDTSYHPVSLYEANKKIFAGIIDSNGTYHILVYDGDWKTVRNDTGLLNGVAWDGTNYYAAAAKGIFVIPTALDKADFAKNTKNEDVTNNVVGILKLEDGKIVAVARGSAESGYLLFKGASDGSFLVTGSINFTFTGAMAVWKDDAGTATLLLLGGQGKRDASSHGYRELNLLNSWGTADIKSPGSAKPTSVQDPYKYGTAVDKYPVQSILQVAPPKGDGSQGIIFAATSHYGLWSFRDGSWNAEE